MSSGTIARSGAAVGVVVLGMGRSGTSAVTGMFVAAGYHAGEPDALMRADADNQLGYFENLAVYRLNEEILRRLGATWFDPPSVAAQLRAAPWAAPKIADAVERMLRTAGGRPIALKDPRISGMIALWGPVVAPLLHPVLVVRDPLEIAGSLLARDRTPIPFSLAAWEMQTELVLAALRGRVVTVVPYRSLFASPDVPPALVGAAAAHLTERCVSCVTPAAAAAALVETLYRNRSRPTDHEQHMTVSQLALWRMLEALPAGDLKLALSIRHPVDGGAQASVRYESARRALADRVAELEAELDHRSRQQAALRGELDSTRAEYERAVTRVRDAEAAQRHGESLLRASESARAAAEAAREQTEAAREQTEAARQQAEADWQRAELLLDVVRRSRSWRITSPLRAVARAGRRATSPAAGRESGRAHRSAR